MAEIFAFLSGSRFGTEAGRYTGDQREQDQERSMSSVLDIMFLATKTCFSTSKHEFLGHAQYNDTNLLQLKIPKEIIHAPRISLQHPFRLVPRS